MTRVKFDELTDKIGFDLALKELYKEPMNYNIRSFSELLDIAIQYIELINLTSAMNILTVAKNPPEDDSDFYFYDKDTDKPPVPLTSADLIEKYIGFDMED